MSPDDARHGTYAGYAAHWTVAEIPCDPCQRAGNRYVKMRRLRNLQGVTDIVSATGTLRRLRALQALGYGYPEIARVAGISESTLRHPSYRSQRIHRDTAAGVVKAYEQLSMRLPEGRYATRNRRMAQRRGWPPPLAWTNIDDPGETPAGWQYVPADRADALAEMDDMQLGVSEVCRRLEVRRDSLEKWCARNQMTAVFHRLVARDDTKVGAA